MSQSRVKSHSSTPRDGHEQLSEIQFEVSGPEVCIRSHERSRAKGRPNFDSTRSRPHMAMMTSVQQQSSSSTQVHLSSLMKPRTISSAAKIPPQFNLEDYHQSLCQREEAQAKFIASVQYLDIRRGMIDWICDESGKMHLHKLTAEIACTYFDALLMTSAPSQRLPPLNVIKLVALACTRLASKMEERGQQARRVPATLKLLEHELGTKATIEDMEIKILTKLEWNLNVVTPLHFVYYFLERGVLFDTDVVQHHKMNSAVSPVFTSYAMFFAEMSLQEHEIQPVGPSVIAAAIVVSSRRAMDIRPTWSLAFDKIFGGCRHNNNEQQQVIMACHEHIWEKYRDQYVVVQASASPTGVSDIGLPNFER